MSIDDGRARGFRKVDVIVKGVVVGKLFYENWAGPVFRLRIDSGHIAPFTSLRLDLEVVSIYSGQGQRRCHYYHINTIIMRKRVAFSKLGRDSAHRLAMFRNMVCSLIEHERIVTTEPKAKELRRYSEQVNSLTLVRKFSTWKCPCARLWISKGHWLREALGRPPTNRCPRVKKWKSKGTSIILCTIDSYRLPFSIMLGIK
jgi:hypothetical protein